MNRVMRPMVCLLAILFAAGMVPEAVQAQQYSVIDLGTLGGGSIAAAVNVRGQVAGWSETAAGDTHAFLHDGTAMRDLGTLGGGFSAAAALNAAGQVAGRSETASGETHAFLFDGKTMRDLGTLGGGASEAVAINASGQVAGWSRTASGDGHAFLWDGATMRDLGTLGGGESYPAALSDTGLVVGWAAVADGTPHAFLWNGSAMRDLGTLDGSASEARDVNASGQVVGTYYVPKPIPPFGVTTSPRAFFFDGTVMVDLGTLGGDEGQAVAISDAGLVVGSADLASGSTDTHAFVFDGAAMTDLGTLGGEESEAVDVNALGQILGMGDDAGSAAGYQWLLWSGGGLVSLESQVLAAGYAGIASRDLRLSDAGQIAGTAITAAGQNRAFLMSTGYGPRLELLVRPAPPAGVVNPEAKGVVQVAVLSQPGLLTPQEVEPGSLTFGRGGTEQSLVECLPAAVDADRNRLDDLLCHFSTAAAGFVPGDNAALLRGRLRDGRVFTAAGALRTVPR